MRSDYPIMLLDVRNRICGNTEARAAVQDTCANLRWCVRCLPGPLCRTISANLRCCVRGMPEPPCRTRSANLQCCVRGLPGPLCRTRSANLQCCVRGLPGPPCMTRSANLQCCVRGLTGPLSRDSGNSHLSVQPARWLPGRRGPPQGGQLGSSW